MATDAPADAEVEILAQVLRERHHRISGKPLSEWKNESRRMRNSWRAEARLVLDACKTLRAKPTAFDQMRDPAGG